MLARLVYAPSKLRRRLQEFGVTITRADHYSEIPSIGGSLAVEFVFTRQQQKPGPLCAHRAHAAGTARAGASLWFSQGGPVDR